MKALIDGDMLIYQAAFSAQFKNEEGEEVLLSAEEAVKIMNNLIIDIVQTTGADEYEVFLTGDTNFRDQVAKREPYKGNRDDKEKPFHYANLRTHLKFAKNATIVEGLEADDLMSIRQWTNIKSLPDFCLGDPYALTTIICSRDKDLRMIPGWHYSWECSNQPEKKPYVVEHLGEWEPKWKKREGKPDLFHKLEATGLRLFYAQVLMGDRVDNIPGLPGCGAKGAYDALVGCESEEELYRVVLGMYEEKYGDTAAEELLEQAQLLWMVRKLKKDGTPAMWRPPV